MSMTLDDIAAVVNMEVGNSTDRGTAHTVGDTSTVEFLIAPPFRTIVDDAEFSFYVDDVLDQTGSMNFADGLYTASSPFTGHNLDWRYNFVYWTRTQVYAAVNAGIGMLFPAFYRTVREEFTTTGTPGDITVLSTGVEELRSVQFSSDGINFSGMKRTGYELDYDDEHTYIRFFNVPATGTIRASFICRPKELATFESVLDITDRAVSPIVSYACYHLLNQKQAPRLRSDIALATMGGGNLSPRQMNDAANSFFLRFQAQKDSLRMRPWRVK